MLPKTIGLHNDLPTVVFRRCLFFILAFTSQSDVVKSAMTMIWAIPAETTILPSKNVPGI